MRYTNWGMGGFAYYSTEKDFGGEGRGEKKLRTRKPMARGLVNHLTITAPQHAALREALRAPWAQHGGGVHSGR